MPGINSSIHGCWNDILGEVQVLASRMSVAKAARGDGNDLDGLIYDLLRHPYKIYLLKTWKWMDGLSRNVDLVKAVEQSAPEYKEDLDSDHGFCKDLFMSLAMLLLLSASAFEDVKFLNSALKARDLAARSGTRLSGQFDVWASEIFDAISKY